VVVLEGSPERGWELVNWSGAPVGGGELVDAMAPDPTGESVAESE
jgi:probable phosphoglycerate mutase